MELKGYQQEVINDLIKYIEFLEKTNNVKKAFSEFWESKGVAINSIDDNYLKPYDNSIKGVPRVTVKVPTAGGKTFIACNALKPIFDSFPPEKPKVAVWFVPSDTILKQTYKNLNDPEHPYRQKIDSHFNGAVKVYLKEDLLHGADFNPVNIKEQLSIFVLSVQSFRARTKEARKAYQENENLQEFPQTYQHKDKLLPDVDETALMQVITQLNPVVIIDESHNFESDLTVDMLNNINPSFVFDLTATPRENSNIISFVDAIKLRKNNMVKLPVIVYNHHDSNEVITSAIQLQKKLEADAIEQEKNGGKYIRPIVLFQAQPKTDDDNVTFEKIKQSLIDLGIPEEEIKIKTANKDEIKNVDLLSKDCEVRYIITVNALKEGWDCPFAYILASLANKSSAVDVEQILGRVLRLPYVTKHQKNLLNLSYVFTSSNNFLQTLDKIVTGLNKAGFSAKDYRVKESQKEEIAKASKEKTFENLLFSDNDTVQTDEEQQTELEIDTDKIRQLSETEDNTQKLDDIIGLADQTNEEFEQIVKELENEDNSIPNEIKEKMKTFPIKNIFKDTAKNIKLPLFYKKVNHGSIFEKKGSYVRITKTLLLEGFKLSSQDKNIDFTLTSQNMASVDLEEGRKDEYTPHYKYVSPRVKEAFIQYISTLSPEGKIKELSNRLARHIRNIDEISEPEIAKYIEDIIKDFDSEKISEISNNDYFYAVKIKNKIKELTDRYAEKQFSILLDKGEIVCNPGFEFSQKISPKNTVKGITKNLYVEEGEMNGFEKEVIFKVANLDSVVFWHRNLERGKGFLINGFINHYPDFIVKLKNGNIVLIETKGDDRDNTDSEKKLKLGKIWESKAGSKYRYFMVFKNVKLDGARTIEELLEILKDMK